MAKKVKRISNKRLSTRFPPDQLSVASLQLSAHAGMYKPDHVALIVNESYSGACLVFQTKKKIKPDLEVVVKIGKLAPLPGEIVWVRQIDVDLFKVGIQYLE